MMEIISLLQYASPEAGSPGLVCGFMVSEAKKGSIIKDTSKYNIAARTLAMTLLSSCKKEKDFSQLTQLF